MQGRNGWNSCNSRNAIGFLNNVAAARGGNNWKTKLIIFAKNVLYFVQIFYFDLIIYGFFQAYAHLQKVRGQFRLSHDCPKGQTRKNPGCGFWSYVMAMCKQSLAECK